MQWFLKQFVPVPSAVSMRVLDVGSYDVNGSYRPLFPAPGFEYVGLDMEAGPNVDVVIDSPYGWDSIESDSFDLVISGQAFEHIEFFWKTMEEMTRVLKKDGLLCLIAPHGFEEHRYPVDCYRFFSDGMVALARYVGIEPLHAHTNCGPDVNAVDWYSDANADSMLIARKPYSGNPVLPDFKTYTCIPVDPEIMRGELVSSPGNRPAKWSMRKIVRRFYKRFRAKLLRR